MLDIPSTSVPTQNRPSTDVSTDIACESPQLDPLFIASMSSSVHSPPSSIPLNVVGTMASRDGTLFMYASTGQAPANASAGIPSFWCDFGAKTKAFFSRSWSDFARKLRALKAKIPKTTVFIPGFFAAT
ncbi:unnamed protein product [Cyclocybe aegerita]|uniref:Uncharacterized protein n=1 Tax=Cyclocybe aegerita TaxID=1973307 RepID=A0A8S0WX44_CYCAE|nr:unnamed protein product [Cyclocybe aegerita]